MQLVMSKLTYIVLWGFVVNEWCLHKRRPWNLIASSDKNNMIWHRMSKIINPFHGLHSSAKGIFDILDCFTFMGDNYREYYHRILHYFMR